MHIYIYMYAYTMPMIVCVSTDIMYKLHVYMPIYIHNMYDIYEYVMLIL